MGCRVKVVPVRVLERGSPLRCIVLRTVGYRAVCDCGERGPVRKTVAAARVWEHARPAQPKA